MTRDDILQKLLDLGLIKASEITKAKSNIPSDASERATIAVLKSQLKDLRTSDFAAAVGLSVIDFQGIPASATPPVTSATAPDVSEAPEGEIPGLSEDFDSYAIGTKLTDIYKALKSRGALTTDQEKALFEKVAGGVTSYRDVEAILNDMRSYGATADELDVLDEAYTSPDYGEGFAPEEQAFLDKNQPEYGGVAALEQEQEERIAAGLEPEGSTWEDRFDASGIGADEDVRDAPKGPDRLRYYKDENFILDRATGKTLSEEQWSRIKEGGEYAEGYTATRRISEVAAELLGSGKFKGAFGTKTETVIGSDGKPVLDSAGNPTYRIADVVKGPEPSGPRYEWVTEGGYDADLGRYITKRIRKEIPDWKQPNRNFLPVEDLALPTPVVTEAWQAPSYDYSVGGGRAEWLGFSERQRAMRSRYMEDQGLISGDEIDAMGGYAGTALNFAMMDIWENVSAISSQLQYSQFDAMNAIGTQIAMNKAAQGGGGGRGGGGGGPTYSVPASLREIPDYKTLAERTKSVFDSELGRDMEDWELAILGDELKDKYTQANIQRIAIHKEAWNDAVSGGSTDVDFTEVEEPEEGLMFDIGEKYKSEIDRYDRVEDRASNRRLLMDSISIGERMV